MLSLISLFEICLLFSVFFCIDALPSLRSEVIESLNTVPKGWKEVAAPGHDLHIRFRVALKSPSLSNFQQSILDISTPGHVRYGRHLKRDEVKAMLRPAQQATEVVTKWLKGSGVLPDDIEDDGNWIQFNATVSQAQTMLDTTFMRYRNTINDDEYVRTLQYSLPTAVHQYINMIQPTTRFPLTPRKDKQSPVPELVRRRAQEETDAEIPCTERAAITPDCIRSVYNFPERRSSPVAGNKLGICTFLESYPAYDDLETFLARYAPTIKSANFSVSASGPAAPIGTSGEANGFVQTSISLAYPVDAVNYAVSGRGNFVADHSHAINQNEPYLDFLHTLSALPDDDLPRTLVIGYGEHEQTVPKQYAEEICNMFAALAGRGVSVLVASGDTGPGDSCLTNTDPPTPRFLPNFPASCPWVTAVGGTEGFAPVSAWTGSGGGFSEYFPRPQWQETAVTPYLESLGSNFTGLYNASGRAMPDVAIQSQNFPMYDNGEATLFSGTSLSTPIFAAIISLLNDVRLSRNQPPLGHLNPWLYTGGLAGLTDVVDGATYGCAAELPGAPDVADARWEARVGWDAATGLGVPDVGRLVRLVEAMVETGGV
ncbi:MAG: polynucleotide 3'-phosphatase [Piccolia ochrophora]|nr:MAG: polynucleotide 3'-phosphatase [Piccolia ochrophora]